jgi:hypothetical protein
MGLATRGTLRWLAAASLWFTVGCGIEQPSPEPVPVPQAPSTFSPTAEGTSAKGDSPTPITDAPTTAELRMGSSRMAFLVSSVAQRNPPQAVHLYNDTDETVTILGAGMFNDLGSPFGQDGARFFSVTSMDPELPATLAPGDAVLFRLSFLPEDELTRQAIFRVVTDSQKFSRLEVSLLGKLYTDPRDPNF